jgi:hypothetical protein
MRLVKDRILCVWEQRRAEAKDRTTEQQRRVSAIQQKLDKLDEAFLYAEAIDVTTYGRQRDKLREELTLAKIDHHSEAVEELDVKGILAFAERILPRAPRRRSTEPTHTNEYRTDLMVSDDDRAVTSQRLRAARRHDRQHRHSH